MNFVLILSIIIMSYISYRSRTVDKFKNSFINFLVQLLHIATLVFILYASITRGSFIVWLFCFLGASTVVNILLELISDIIYTLFPAEEEPKDIEPSDKDKIDSSNEQVQNETTVDNDKEDR